MRRAHTRRGWQGGSLCPRGRPAPAPEALALSRLGCGRRLWEQRRCVRGLRRSRLRHPSPRSRVSVPGAEKGKALALGTLTTLWLLPTLLSFPSKPRASLPSLGASRYRGEAVATAASVCGEQPCSSALLRCRTPQGPRELDGHPSSRPSPQPVGAASVREASGLRQRLRVSGRKFELAFPGKQSGECAAPAPPPLPALVLAVGRASRSTSCAALKLVLLSAPSPCPFAPPTPASSRDRDPS